VNKGIQQARSPTATTSSHLSLFQESIHPLVVSDGAVVVDALAYVGEGHDLE
jgi:hypothetical protein